MDIVFIDHGNDVSDNGGKARYVENKLYDLFHQTSSDISDRLWSKSLSL